MTAKKKDQKSAEMAAKAAAYKLGIHIPAGINKMPIDIQDDSKKPAPANKPKKK